MPTAPQKYGELPFSATLGLVATILPLPAILLWTILVSSHASYNKGKTMTRILGNRVLLHFTNNFSIPQLQYAFGNTLSIYQKWTKSAKLSPVVDELEDDARLLWIGPKRTDRVLLYCHGGCYFLPTTDFTLAFWHYVQGELKKKDIELGIAFLSYSLAPMAKFPTPLKQASLAIEFLWKSGVRPENLYLAGDSAGGNLALQVLSHMLHPKDGIPAIRPAAPLRGVYLMSPMASFTVEAQSITEFDGIDYMPKRFLQHVGSQILAAFPTADAAFAEPAKAPSTWFAGVNDLFERMLITAGATESMRDDILRVADVLKKHSDSWR